MARRPVSITTRYQVCKEMDSRPAKGGEKSTKAKPKGTRK